MIQIIPLTGVWQDFSAAGATQKNHRQAPNR